MKNTLLALLLAALPLAAVELWRQGDAATPPIVVAADSVEPVRLAAQELKTWLEKGTGAIWQITDQAPVDGKALYVGPSALLNQPDAPDCSTLPHDGYWHRADATGLRIAGRDYPGGSLGTFCHPWRDVEMWNEELRLCALGDMGTWYGVMHFLESLGFRWYMPGEDGTVIPELTVIDVPEETKTNAPSVEYRYTWICNFEEFPEVAAWCRRVGFGGPAPVLIIHSYGHLLDYAEEHPEFFALVNGERDFDDKCSMWGGHLCLNSEGLVQKWVDHICQYFTEHPEQTVYPLCPNDGLVRICECPKCQAQLSPWLGRDGIFSNHIWTFSNKIATELGKRMPDKKVGTFAYERYRELPDCLDKLSDNLAVMICYTRQQMRDPAFKEHIREVIGKWSALAGNVYLWTYPHKEYWEPWRGFPRFYPDLLAEDIRANRDINAKGEFIESESRYSHDPVVPRYTFHWPALYHLGYYLYAKLLWNPDMDYRAELDDYYKRYFGPAYIQMKAFWEAVEANTMAKNEETPVQQFSLEELKLFQTLLDNALSACAPDSVFYRRIAKLESEMRPYSERIRNLEGRAPMEIPYTEEILPVDGKTLWPQARRCSLVEKFSGNAPAVPTEALLGADPEGLAFTFVCHEPAMDQIADFAKEHDSADVWMGDSVELHFCQPDGLHGGTIILSPGNVSFDAGWLEDASPDVMSWTPGLSTATCKLEDRWIAQFKIPWKDLGVAPGQSGEILRGNIFRIRVLPDGETQYSAFAQTATQKHRTPAVFVPIIIK